MSNDTIEQIVKLAGKANAKKYWAILLFLAGKTLLVVLEFRDMQRHLVELQGTVVKMEEVQVTTAKAIREDLKFVSFEVQNNKTAIVVNRVEIDNLKSRIK